MSYIFQQLNNIMTGILIVITVFAALFFLIMYRSRKKKRVSFDEDDTDYAEFDRKNVKDYIKIDEDGIKDDMISLENGKRVDRRQRQMCIRDRFRQLPVNRIMGL